MIQIKRALISVSDKSGLVEFAKGLQEYGVEIISTGGTHKLLEETGIAVKKVSDITGFPEILDGRVKTLHPHIFGGILAVKDSDAHKKDLQSENISTVDLVVINFYPFEKSAVEGELSVDKAIEFIDIGGPSALRAASKNYKYTVPVSSVERYGEILEEMKNNNGGVSEELSFKLAREVFEKTAQYDQVIFDYLSRDEKEEELFSKKITLNLCKVNDLRYGENPHQKAAYYIPCNGTSSSGLQQYEQIHGKELSFNNLIDLDGALNTVGDFDVPCAAIIKHTNPCGVGIDTEIAAALNKALECDPVSAFGGIFAFNRTVNSSVAEILSKMFLEAVIAPQYEEDALEILSKKKKLILLKKKDTLKDTDGNADFDLKKIRGGYLLQEYDTMQAERDKMEVVTKRQPADEEMEAMLFGWKVIKYVKSNAVIFTTSDRTLGIGAGQMSRVDSCDIAIKKAGKMNLSLKGSAVSSDAFFPFGDSIELLAEAGATAVIQPGGSIRDKEVIEAADKHNIAMVFAGFRQFRH